MLVTQKRKTFTPVCRVLSEWNVRFQLIYPVEFKIWDGPTPTTFDDPPEARCYLRMIDDGD